jgi:hypothetical protein
MCPWGEPMTRGRSMSVHGDWGVDGIGAPIQCRGRFRRPDRISPWRNHVGRERSGRDACRVMGQPCARERPVWARECGDQAGRHGTSQLREGNDGTGATMGMTRVGVGWRARTMGAGTKGGEKPTIARGRAPTSGSSNVGARHDPSGSSTDITHQTHKQVHQSGTWIRGFRERQRRLAIGIRRRASRRLAPKTEGARPKSQDPPVALVPLLRCRCRR